MKRIIVCIENKYFLEQIESFCHEEKIAIHAVSSPEELDNEPFIVIITDKKDLIEAFSTAGKTCIITNDKILNNVYCLKESFNHTHLRLLVDIIFHGALFTNYSPSLMPYVFHKEYTISNDFFNIDRLVYAMTAEFVLFFKFSELEKMRVGISEMLTNSIEHGNLEITAEEKFKATEEGTYYKLLNERLSNKELAERTTHINIDLRDNTLTVTITDQGNGFDTTKFPDPTDTEHLLKLHGRGIFITRMYFSEIKYNKKGNEVTLIKRLP